MKRKFPRTHVQQKYYAVLNGRDGERFIYDNWGLTHRATAGVKGCKFKSFTTRKDAERYFGGSAIVELVRAKTEPKKQTVEPSDTVYCDGGCKGNGTDHAIGGIGVYYGLDDPRNISMRVVQPVPTNNSCELWAAILALAGFEPFAKGTIKTDSEYTLTKFSQPTVDSSDVNYTLIRQLHVQRDLHPNVQLEKVSAHCGIVGNEGADKLATLAFN